MDSLGETEVIYRISDYPQRRNHAAKYAYIHTAESYIRVPAGHYNVTVRSYTRTGMEESYIYRWHGTFFFLLYIDLLTCACMCNRVYTPLDPNYIYI